LFGELITHDLADKDHDKLFFCLNELTSIPCSFSPSFLSICFFIDLHQELVQMRNKHKNALFVDFENEKSKLRFLPHDITTHHMLATGDIDGDFERYAISHLELSIRDESLRIKISPSTIEREVTRSLFHLLSYFLPSDSRTIHCWCCRVRYEKFEREISFPHFNYKIPR